MLGAFFAKYKVLVYVVAVTALVGTLFAFSKWAYDEVYDAGYNKAVSQYQEATQKAVDSAVSDVTERLRATIAQKQIELETLARMNKALSKTREKEVIYRDIPKIVENSDCKRLGSDVLGLFNAAIGEDPTAK